MEHAVFEAYLEESALKKAWEHAQQASAQGKEAMGLLAGEVREWQGRRYVVASDYLTAGNSATAVSVKFSKEAFPQLAAEINNAKGNKKMIVGWLHSHPSYGCFLSQTDLQTQKRYFSEEFSIAMVVDPVRNEKAVFKLEAGGAPARQQYRRATYAVIRKK